MKQRKIAAVLFDLDGVLADSEALWTDIDAQLLGEQGIAYNGEHKNDVLGKNFPTALSFYRNRYNLRASVEELSLRRREIAADFYARRIAIFPAAAQVLQTLRENSFKIALATSSIRPLVDPFLARHDIAHFFDAVTTGDEIENGKPAPDIYLSVAEKIDVPPELCLVVEDALAGVEAAKRARMRVAAIPDARWVDVAKFDDFADFVLENLDGLLPLIERLNAENAAR